MSDATIQDLIQTDWEYDELDAENKPKNASQSIEKETTDICGVYEVVVVNGDFVSPVNSQTSADEGCKESHHGSEISSKQIITEGCEKSQFRNKKTYSKKTIKKSRVSVDYCSSVESSEEELSKSSKCKSGRKKKRKVLRKQPSKATKGNADNAVPSVYSCAEIKRHKKRLKMKAMAESTDTDSDTAGTENNVDPDLDINLRIFEGSTKSIENVVIGEIHCDVLKDKCNTEEKVEANKNTNVFKLSVNANFSEDKCENSAVDDVGDLEGLSDEYLFSDNDSDLEILTSKPIVRKRAIPVLKKERTFESDKKKTMYDLIQDAVTAPPKIKDESGEIEKKKDTKNKDCQKSKTFLEKKIEQNGENSKKIDSIPKERNESLPVPQLKVNADGEVIIDMDSLVIEQTGMAEAREALKNSEVVQETGLSYSTYTRKCPYRKQWSPHDTLRFYDVLSTIGTDFSLMATLFPGRTRNCMKRKFKREEKINSDLILKALTCRQKFNIGLLEKELKLKEHRVNLLKKSKTEKIKKEKNEEKIKNKKETKFKRKSFFERGISCFQMTEEHS